MTEPREPQTEAPRPPGTPEPDLDVDLPVDDGGDDQPGNTPVDDDVEPGAGTMEPPD
jgi:hypothetical protein